MKYPDNTGAEVIKLLDERQKIGSTDSKNGILTVVNDCSKQQPRPTFEYLMDVVTRDHGGTPKIHYDFMKDKNRDKFTILHSAKEVKYDIKTFIVKNVDSISPSLEDIVAKDADDQISWIYTLYVPEIPSEESDESPTNKKTVLKTIWSKFSVQMRDLMYELAEPLLDLGEALSKKKRESACDPCELHFLRCIKPNEEKAADFFVDSMTLLQMTYMGVLESIAVKQKNFPYRRKFTEFYQRYEDLCSISASKRYNILVAENADFRSLCQKILDETFRGLADKLYAFGHHKVFLKNELVQVLEKARYKAQEKKSKAVNLIQRCFQIQMAKLAHKDKMIKIVRIQRFWRKRGELLIQNRAKEFLSKAKNAVLKYKKLVDKEKMEIEAKNRIVRAFKLNVLKQKMIRYSICYRGVLDIFERSWEEIRENSERQSSLTVQRIFRGYLLRQKHKKAIEKAMEVRLNCVSTKALRVIQKAFRGVLVRNRLRTLHLAAAYIQGHMRMRWLSALFQKIRFEVRKIQRAVRKFLIRKKRVQERLVEFFSKEVGLLENVRNVENFAMFGDSSSEAERTNFFQNHTPYNLKKISLFSQIIDVHIMCDTSDVYETPWSLHWHQLSKELLINDAPLQRVTLGSSHTLAISNKSKLYSWGWNEFGQCGHSSDEVLKKEIRHGTHAVKQLLIPDYTPIPECNYGRIKQIVSGEEHNLIRDENGNVFAFGSNAKGQLGMGNYEDLYMPTRVEALPENSIKEIAACGDQNLACTLDGQVYIWPCVKEGQKISIPQSINFASEKIKISNVSCGYNFGILLSTQGLVFSFGKNNSDGQLGHGDKEARGFPDMIQSLKDAGEKIETIECGFRHVIAKTSLGKIYTWGWGLHGQLGHGIACSELSPRHLNLDEKNRKNRGIQVAAGYEHSVVLLESRDILWFGRNGTLKEASYKPVKMVLSDKIPEIFPPFDQISAAVNPSSEFLVTKINCSWNKSISLTDVVVADVRSLENVTQHAIQGAIKTLSNGWHTKEVEPPYIEAIAKYFSVNTMKKPSAPVKTKSSGSVRIPGHGKKLGSPKKRMY